MFYSHFFMLTKCYKNVNFVVISCINLDTGLNAPDYGDKYMRRTGLIGLLLLCTLTTAMPVQAAAQTEALPAAEAAINTEAAPNADESAEESSLAETVPEAETEADAQKTDSETQVQETGSETRAQETDTETQAQESGKPALAEDDPALKGGSDEKDDPVLTENSDQIDNSGLAADPDQKEDEIIEVPEQEETSDLSDDTVLADQPVPEAVEETVTEDTAAVSSDEETAYSVSAEDTVYSVLAKASADLTAEMDKDRIHFITLNGSYSDSDAILIESNGKYGLIDSSNPSKASGDPNLAFTSEYVDTAANGLTVVKYLTDLNISHLEFVLATHSHSDHIGGMSDIAASGLVNSNTVYIYKEYQAVMGEGEWHNDYYANLALEAMRARDVTLLNVLNPSAASMQALGDNGAALIRDSEDRVGDHLEFTLGDFVLRLFNLHTESSVNENLNSIVTAVKHNNSGSGALLMADMEQQHYMESRTVDAVVRNDSSFKADVYKAGHHGYYTSTSYDTIETLKPANCVLTTRSTNKAVSSYTLFPYYVQRFGGKVFRTSENGPAIVADFGDSNVIIKKLAKNNALAAPVQWKPVVADGWHMWYPNEDSYNRTGVKWTYFKSGAPLKGWFNVSGKWYHADDKYIMQTGWVSVGGKRYFLNGSGVMQTGWTRFEGKWYLLGSDGAMQTGWKNDGGKWYYLGTDGVMRLGRQVIGGKAYLFDTHGVMQTGWASYAGKWYFMNSSGIIQTGWKNDGGKWYYLGTDGVMRVGKQVIGGKAYLFNSSGIMQTGWASYAGKWYFLNSDGVMQTGWKKDGGKWYFLNSNGVMQTGRKAIGGKTYFFNSSGAMLTGWVNSAGKWYFMNSDGSMHIGWIKDGGKWYYMASNGVMQTGRKLIGGKTYFFNGSGVMLTGWINSAGKWYFMNSDGSMHIGWIKDGGKWYYMASNGVMQTGRKLIGGKTYFFNSSGVMLTGWINSAGKWYYLDSSGAMVANKWVGDYFLKSNGEMAVNTWIGSYYVGKDGKWIPGAKKAA